MAERFGKGASVRVNPPPRSTARLLELQLRVVVLPLVVVEQVLTVSVKPVLHVETTVVPLADELVVVSTQVPSWTLASEAFERSGASTVRVGRMLARVATSTR